MSERYDVLKNKLILEWTDKDFEDYEEISDEMKDAMRAEIHAKLSERYDVLENKPLDEWTDKNIEDYEEITAVNLLAATKGNDLLGQTLLNLLILITLSAISQRADAAKREAALRQDIRAFIEEQTEGLVEFQFEEHSKRNTEEHDILRKKIDRINQWRDHFGGR